jgi:hypothetical protein
MPTRLLSIAASDVELLFAIAVLRGLQSDIRAVLSDLIAHLSVFLFVFHRLAGRLAVHFFAVFPAEQKQNLV